MKIKLLLIFMGLSALVKAQAFKEGDIVLSAGYGVPNTAASVTRFALRVAYPNSNSSTNALTFSSKGVYSLRGEYAINKRFGLGVSVANWSMKIGIDNYYQDYNTSTGQNAAYIDNYNIGISALAIGVRANYHFGKEKSKIDPFVGATLGITKYSYSVGFNSTYPGKQLPVTNYTFKSGVGSYISLTAGFRYFPARWFGFNFEGGFDRGALFIAGIAVKISTKNE